MPFQSNHRSVASIETLDVFLKSNEPAVIEEGSCSGAIPVQLFLEQFQFHVFFLLLLLLLLLLSSFFWGGGLFLLRGNLPVSAGQLQGNSGAITGPIQ